ncbi:MAG TPA: hypothetical protein PKC21_03260 [Oligoflexia bacterium]|nr:hypothetical protein [Oligoflexia bacterium]
MIISGAISALFGLCAAAFGLMMFFSLMKGPYTDVNLIAGRGFDYSVLPEIVFYLTLPLIGVLMSVMFLYHRKIFNGLYDLLIKYKKNQPSLENGYGLIKKIIFWLKMIIFLHVIFKIYDLVVINPFINSNHISPKNGEKLVHSFSNLFSIYDFVHFNMFAAIFLLGVTMITRDIIFLYIEEKAKLDALENENALVI